MSRLALILVAGITLFVQAVSVDAATVSITNNRSNLSTGETLVTTITITNSGSPVTVDAYLALLFPDGSLVFFEDDNGLVAHPATTDPSSWTKLFSDFTLTESFTTGSLSIFTYTFQLHKFRLESRFEPVNQGID